jgi:L-fuconolactonase
VTVDRVRRIDAHQHFWRYDPVAYDWIDGSMAPLKRDFLPADLEPELHAAGFEGCVSVQARQSADETAWLLRLASEHAWIEGVVGWVDLQSPEVAPALAALAGEPKIVGVRHVVQAEADGFLDRPAFRRGIAALEHVGLAYDILVFARQLPEVVRFADAFPSQRFVLDHLGKPDIRGNGFDSWRRELDRLAARPHVWAKLSGLVTEADWRAWTPDDLRRYVHAALDAFGPDRLMIGSDWPVCTLAADYRTTMDVVRGALDERPAREREAVLGGTASRFWNLEQRV